MKKYLLFSVLGIAMLMVSGCSTDQVSQEEETPYIPPSETTTSYTIPDHEIDFEYLDNWTIEEPGENADEYALFSVSTPNGNSMDVKYYPEDTKFKIEDGKEGDFMDWIYDQSYTKKLKYKSNTLPEINRTGWVYFTELVQDAETQDEVIYCKEKNLGHFWLTGISGKDSYAQKKIGIEICDNAFENAWNNVIDLGITQTYTSEKIGISLQYPDVFEVRDETYIEEDTLEEKDYVSIAYPEIYIIDIPGENISITRRDIDDEKIATVKTYFKEGGDVPEGYIENTTRLPEYTVLERKVNKESNKDYYIYNEKDIYRVNISSYYHFEMIGYGNAIVSTLKFLD